MSYKKLKDKYYHTSDLALSAAIFLYYPVKGIDKGNLKKIIFIFEKDKKFDLLIENYWCGKLKVDPQRYFNSIKTLKNRIYNI